VAAPFSDALRLIETKAILAAVTSVTFSGLAGDSDGVYWLLFRCAGQGAGASLFIRPNGISTNQDNVVMQYNGAADAHATSADLRFAASDAANDIIIGHCLFFAATGLERGGVSHNMSQVGAATDTLGRAYAFIWNEAATAITSLEVHSTTASGLTVGSVLSLYKYLIA
jgi:hypothetical protein